ncbi:MAG: hypothetical protein LBI96_07925 [Odoribacteraceae bacterium]|nr:hypothetical protein [Odoribacteraceae bacterium]
MKDVDVCRVSAAGGEGPLEALRRVSPPVLIGEAGWGEAFPCRPLARFRIGYDAGGLLVFFEVEEGQFRAAEGADGGRVWEDSCVEFFFQPGGEGGYYNFECNAAGSLVFAFGEGREGREAAPAAVSRLIRRRGGMEVSRGEVSLFRWWMLLEIPFAALFRDRFAAAPGMVSRGNFYKCGDLLAEPHFLSWNPVVAARPDFHRPECFGRLSFRG